MVAKELSFLANADAAGIVLGARETIILTSQADKVRREWRAAPWRRSTPTPGGWLPLRSANLREDARCVSQFLSSMPAHPASSSPCSRPRRIARCLQMPIDTDDRSRLGGVTIRKLCFFNSFVSGPNARRDLMRFLYDRRCIVLENIFGREHIGCMSQAISR